MEGCKVIKSGKGKRKRDKKTKNNKMRSSKKKSLIKK